MKRFCMMLLALILALSLAGCGADSLLEVTDRYGNAYIIDREQGTISDAEYTYLYRYEGDSEVFQISIEYPNGSTYHYQQSNGFGSSGHSSGYSEEIYTPGDLLADVLRDHVPKRGSARKILAALVLAAGGIFFIARPDVVWFLDSGWRYRNAEPSDAALVFARISGVIALIFAVIVILC